MIETWPCSRAHDSVSSRAAQLKHVERKRKRSPIERELELPPEPAERCSACQHIAVVRNRCEVCGTTAARRPA